MNETSQSLERDEMYREVHEGLTSHQKTLPSKYFYDEKGSRLFDQITELDEYYPTRCELEIMQENIGDIAKCLGEKILLIEFGSGSSQKTRLLLKHVSNIAGYVPIDISGEYLFETADKLRKEFPLLDITPLAADYTRSFDLPGKTAEHDKVIAYYPGSTIGNFAPKQARNFLKNTASLIGSEGGMLIGVDLKKDREILEAAYNDSKGVTAAFNKNILRHINRELDADFNIDGFAHKAIYNATQGRIEMHLVSRYEQKTRLGDEQINFDEGESIHTENSYKYTLHEFKEMASPWFTVENVWTDENNYFSVQYLRVFQDQQI